MNTEMRVQALRGAAALAIGGLISMGIKTGDPYAWIMAGIAFALLGLEFASYLREQFPKLREYKVVLQHVNTRETLEVPNILARNRVDAMDIARGNLEPHEQHDWSVRLIEEVTR